MPKENPKEPPVRERFQVQFNLREFVIFSISLVAVTGLLAFLLVRPANKSGVQPFASNPNTNALARDKAPVETPPWGELITHDIQMECPEEYAAAQINPQSPAWIFNNMKLGQVRELMLACGLTEQQAGQALSSQNILVTETNIAVKPNDDLVFSMSPDVRGKLYGKLAENPANYFMYVPICFPEKSFDQLAASGRVPAEIISMVRPLLYHRGAVQYFSDLEAVMRRVPSDAERLQFIKVFFAEPVLQVGIRIRPGTDIDKLLGYWAWAPGVRFTNLRPLLDSLQRLEDGGSVSLLYFLPPFARDRIFTYPQPSQSPDPAMDCNWSTFNFFNETPDDRFADSHYVVSYVTSHYYEVSKPTRYGDLILFLNEQGQPTHSAVYVCDDIVFTKGGADYMDPWMLMRLKNLLGIYAVTDTSRVVVYRNKNL
jgi:hypothetical protein